MARHKEFDPDVVLKRAMELFRARGYGASSTTALVGEMGIGRGSLYETFGTKDEVFLAALRLYQEKSFGGMIAKLDDSADPVETIRGIFQGIGTSHARGNVNGCLMVNTTVELAPHDAEVRDYLRAAWARLERAFMRALKRGGNTSPRATARFLITVMRGMGVGTKLGPGRTEVNEVVAMAMRVLD